MVALCLCSALNAQNAAESAPGTPSRSNVSTNLLQYVETLSNQTNQISYTLGVNIARNLQARFPAINVDFLQLGLQDVFTTQKLKMSDQAISQALVQYEQISTAHVQQTLEELKSQNLAEAKRYLEENGKKESVVSLPSGLQYRIISPGQGPKPSPDGIATVQLHVMTPPSSDGSRPGRTVESTLEGAQNDPVQIDIGNALPFWREALPMMSVGAKWELYVPPTLAYGESGSDKVNPNELLIYYVELVDVR